MNIFNKIYDFLDSFSGMLTYNYIFLFSVGLFILVALFVFISTSRSYEAKLVKAVDMLNSYFSQYPQINDETLVPFNNKMKSNKVPKLLRKQWQQYVLYRDGKASSYMSFETCVSEPIKNSSFKRDIMTLNVLSYILIFISLVFNLFESYEIELYSILRHCLVTPVIILVLNYIMTIFLNVKHNAIVSDLHTSYQYFEVNIDKATKTLPEYIDYEVLFDREEIKQGIPILYAYLQKRADEEQRELERARLRNVEHEKFNFDQAGVESALVLERAMQEAENYIAERKKLMQDIEQINTDIAQEDLNFRETTKEYQRQMQVSKESFANFKAQLEEETSSISINYLKKQQQQELDRQRNLERDYDTASDRHKKINDEFYAELKSVEEEIQEARKRLEEAMMNEFATYSAKVYKEAEKIAAKNEHAKTEKLKNEIQDLEETIVSKDQEISTLYDDNMAIDKKIHAISNKVGEALKDANEVKTKDKDVKKNAKIEKFIDKVAKMKAEDEEEEPQHAEEVEEEGGGFSFDPFAEENRIEESQEPVKTNEDDDNDIFRTSYFDSEDDSEDVEDEDSGVETEGTEAEESTVNDEFFDEDEYDEFDFSFADEEDDEEEFKDDDFAEEPVDEGETTEPDISTTKEAESKPKARRGRPRKESTVVKFGGKRPGRPRKETVEGDSEKKRPGRPRKESKVEVKPRKKAGRPRKIDSTSSSNKKRPGRPRKTEESIKVSNKKGPGRPRKTEGSIKVSNKKRPGRPKKEVSNISTSKGRGRPRKSDLVSRAVDLDKVLKEINEAIAVENSKIEKSKKELERKSKISKKK